MSRKLWEYLSPEKHAVAVFQTLNEKLKQKYRHLPMAKTVQPQGRWKRIRLNLQEKNYKDMKPSALSVEACFTIYKVPGDLKQ